jgi:hypothetical protein
MTEDELAKKQEGQSAFVIYLTLQGLIIRITLQPFDHPLVGPGKGIFT